MGSRRRVQAEGENIHKGSIMHSLVNHARAFRFYSEAKRVMRSYFLFFFKKRSLWPFCEPCVIGRRLEAKRPDIRPGD